MVFPPPLGTQNIGYTYGDISLGQMPDQIYKVSWNGQDKISNSYDPLGRLSGKSIFTDGAAILYAYGYENVDENHTTTLLSSMRTSFGVYRYTYDAVGNIKSVAFGTRYTNTYEYDSLNQLVRENNQRFGKTYTYTYTNGNITERKEYAYTTGELGTPQYVYNWSYGDGTWSDLLTAWNEGTESSANASSASAFSLQNTSESDETAQSFFKRALQRSSANSNVSRAARTTDTTPSFSYDEIGNPTEIFGLQFSWNGRTLTSVTVPDDPYVSRVDYGYNMDGQRISKTLTAPDGTVTTTEYFYNGENLAGEKTGDRTVVYMYDNNGDIFGFTVNGRTYYYVKNAQNDVTAITDSNGTVVVRYYYDAWGYPNYTHYACTGQTLDDVRDNPILYRSYYYDNDSGFYYLNSRYYVPMFCRFLNFDGIINANQDVLGNNLFAYCSNDPVNNFDNNGCGKLSNWFKSAVQTVKNWWNSTPPAHSYTIPATNQIVSQTSDIVLGATANYTGKYSKTVHGIISYTKNYNKSASTKLYPAGKSVKPYTGISKAANKVSAAITIVSLTLDLGNTWTANNGNTNGDRIIKSAIQIGGVVAGIGVGAIAAAVSAPTLAGAVTFAAITVVGGIVIDHTCTYLTNKAGIE